MLFIMVGRKRLYNKNVHLCAYTLSVQRESYSINRFRTKSKNYNVRVYHCNNCGHIFHTLMIGLEYDNCVKCRRGILSIIDKYKSKFPPRNSGKKDKWLTKWGAYTRTEIMK